jgi:polysaccharide export outer membrane protein
MTPEAHSSPRTTCLGRGIESERRRLRMDRFRFARDAQRRRDQRRRGVVLVMLSIAFSLAASACVAGRPRYDFAAERRATSAYSVGAGDLLAVNVWKIEQLSQRVVVRPDGFITLPLDGDVKASGRTVDAIGGEIADRALRFYTERPVVSVEVAELHSYRIYVLGEVTRPGEFTPRGQVTVLQAIALAGGFTRFAAPNQIVIVRRDSQGDRRIPFVYGQVVEKGDLAEDLPLQTNDTLVVP